MPGFDRTGPVGQGSMTGRGMGRCGTGGRSGLGLGLGRRFGAGRGRGGFSNWVQTANVDRKQDLADYRKALEEELEDVKKEEENLSKAE